MNYAELMEAVKAYLECDETTFNDNFPLFVQLAEEDIYRQVQLQFLKKTSSLVMTPASRTMDAPDDMLAVYSFAFVNDSNEFVYLLEKEDDFLREAYPGSTPGVPRYYSYKDENEFLIAPTPNNGYVVELIYFYKPESLSAGSPPDDNTNWLSENGENALLFGTVVHGYIYLKGDQDTIALYKEKFDNAIADLKVISEGRQRKDTYRTMDRRIPT